MAGTHRKTPRIVSHVRELPHGETYCTCCEKHMTGKFAWLELDQRNQTYHDFGGVPNSKSQGWFPFGIGCAKTAIAQAHDKAVTA